VTVSAKERTTGNTNEITITNDKGRLSAKEIKRLVQEAESYQAEDQKFLRKANAMNALSKYAYKMKSAMKDTNLSSKILPIDEQKIRAAI
ncbi:Hsp70 family protein, partial [Pseudomonas syringae]|uniref:Hsp70 family protein n=1 Tax=Pseudomonas syringae TaxID=317 RepID=UPI0034D4C90C